MFFWKCANSNPSKFENDYKWPTFKLLKAKFIYRKGWVRPIKSLVVLYLWSSLKFHSLWVTLHHHMVEYKLFNDVYSSSLQFTVYSLSLQFTVYSSSLQFTVQVYSLQFTVYSTYKHKPRVSLWWVLCLISLLGNWGNRMC